MASFNQRFGAGLVKDRYLFYVVPVVLVGLAAAVASRQWPRWWALVVPTGVAAVGFASAPLALYEKFNVDSPVAILNNKLLELATSTRWAHVLLVLAVLVAAQALLLAKPFIPWRATAISVAVLATVVLPLETVYAFDRLFAVNGTNGLPITLDQGVVFNWVDRNVGPTGRVTVMKYPVGGPDWWAGQGYWWDVEFWNESAVDTMADMSLKKTPHWRRTSIRARAPRSTRRRRSSRSSTRRTCASGSRARSASTTASAYVFETAAAVAGDMADKTGSTRMAGRDRTGPRRSPSSPSPARSAAPALYHDLRRVARPARATARYDQLEPRALARRDPAGHVDRPRSCRSASPPAARAGDGVDALRVGRLPRPDEVRAVRLRRPPGRSADPLDRARRRARPGRSLPDVR